MYYNGNSDLYYIKPGLQEVIGKSVNGTTYAGLRARTTGAPQNHWYVEDPKLPFFLSFFLASQWALSNGKQWFYDTGLGQQGTQEVQELGPQKQ